MRGQSAGEADLREHALYIWRVYMYGLNVLQLLTHGCVCAVLQTWKNWTSGMLDVSGVVMVVVGRRWCSEEQECGWVGMKEGGWVGCRVE